MAKQNFLNGGYIGKLGNTVGQRWKDKKIIRTYVVPANPNTPAQQTARQQFATANKLAQQAMTINGHTGVWDTSTKPEYSQRVGQAMRRLRLGYSEQDSLPLFPEGQAPAVGLAINAVSYNPAAQKYTFTTQGFGINNPLAAEITFYTPLNYSAGKYNENIIHATVDAPAGTFSVDLSATNQADGQTVKTLFNDAMQLGFCAMKATFFDALGATLSNISIARKYKVANMLYDFDESLVMLDSTQKVTFTQAFSQNRIEGSISPFQSAGFPIVYRISTENQYYGGFVAETAESSFIQMDANTNKTFTIPVTPASGHLQETTTTTYGLTVGATQPQITKDVSTATYQLQINQTAITNIVFAGNTITFSLDQNVKASYAVAGTLKITYKDLSKWPAMTNSTITGPITIATAGTSFSITNANVPKLGGVILGSVEVTFTDNAGDPIAGLAPDKTVNVAGKYYYSNLQNSLAVTQTASIVSGKAIAGNVKASFRATAVPPVACVYQNGLIVTYKGNVTEFFLVSGIKTSITTAQNITVATTANTGKEIIKMEVITLAVASSSANASAGWTSATASAPTSFTLPALTYDSGALEASITLPTGIPSYLGRVGGRWRAWESTSRSIKTATINPMTIPTNRTILLDVGDIGADSTEFGAPIFIELQFFYEDNTACTTTKLVVPLPIDNQEELMVPYNAAAVKTSSGATIDLAADGEFTLKFTNNVFNSAYIPIVPAVYTWEDVNDDVILEGVETFESNALNQAYGTAGYPAKTGTGISLKRNGALLGYYYDNNIFNLVAVV